MDPVNKPAHYEDGRKISPLAVLEDWHLDYFGGNMLKYLARWRRKNGIQDLEKLRWYGNRAMERWKSMDDVKRGLLSAAQQSLVRSCKIDMQDVINDWALCREEQNILACIYLAAFNGDPVHYADAVNLIDTWLTTTDVRQVDEALRPRAYCAGILQLDGDDIPENARQGDLYIFLRDGKAGRSLQASLLRQ